MSDMRAINELHRRWLAQVAEEYDEVVLENPNQNPSPDSDYTLWAMSIQADETEFFDEVLRMREEQAAPAVEKGFWAGVFKHLPGQHDQKAHGRKRGGRLLATVIREGGFTYSTRLHRSPKTGFIVSPYKEHERIIGFRGRLSRDELRAAINDYAREMAGVLARPGHYIGGWHDKRRGRLVLDVVVRSSTLAQARVVAQEADQDAVYDVERGQVVNVR